MTHGVIFHPILMLKMSIVTMHLQLWKRSIDMDAMMSNWLLHKQLISCYWTSHWIWRHKKIGKWLWISIHCFHFSQFLESSIWSLYLDFILSTTPRIQNASSLYVVQVFFVTIIIVIIVWWLLMSSMTKLLNFWNFLQFNNTIDWTF